ncbi:kinase-like protein [Xylaria sp. FL1777]|nr:kinase-like protein [Xylaria sp. FL1777]
MRTRATIELANRIKNNFETSKYWEFEETLGAGSFGIAVLLKERKHAVEHVKRIAVKLAQSPGVKQLQNEIEWLKKLHGGMHIVKMLASCDDLVAAANEPEERNRLTEFIDRTLETFSKIRQIPPITAFDTLVGMKGPALAIEYLENGDFLHFKQALHRAKIRPPNRVLRSLFLCLIRACIGMAYPIGRTLGTPSILETIPTDGRHPTNMIHGDIAPRNIMLGSLDNLDEHSASVALKMIDFGSAVEYQGIGYAVASNIRDVAMVVPWEGSDTQATVILPTPDGRDPYPSVDLELRDLIARCMYSDPYKRPSLEQLLEIASNAVQTKTPQSFPNPEQESDAAVRAFWKRFAYDAPFPPS